MAYVDDMRRHLSRKDVSYPGISNTEVFDAVREAVVDPYNTPCGSKDVRNVGTPAERIKRRPASPQPMRSPGAQVGDLELLSVAVRPEILRTD